MYKQFSFLIIAASVGFACLATSCKTAKPTTSAQAQLTQSHSTALCGVERDGWQRNIAFDSIIITLPLRGGMDGASNPSDSDSTHTATATHTSRLRCDPCAAFAECSKPTAMKVYGLHLSENSKKQSIVTDQTCDSLDASRQSQLVTCTKSKAPSAKAWPLTVAILTVIIATAIWYYSRKRQ